jgi:transposase InsO family protein
MDCFYLSTILDDFSHCIIAWKLCTGRAASNVQDTQTWLWRKLGLIGLMSFIDHACGQIMDRTFTQVSSPINSKIVA